jgi:N-acetylglucosaminyldiphosphoundecaprenol N-acetyl-beta-D-mannosaminyltransferase
MIHQKFIKLNLSLGSFQDFVKDIVDMGHRRASSYVCIVNVHSCIEAYKDKAYAELINNAALATPDGMPLVNGLKWLYGIEQEKVSGPDLMPVLLKEAAEKSLHVFFYGSTDEVLQILKLKAEQIYPNLKIAGMISPPFRKLSYEEIQNDIEMINNAGTNILFVALGCPKQERWMAEMKGKINAVMIGVGGAFPMLAGIEKRAPLWMQKNMLEWLYRLLQDPKRLFKRYLITNTLFIFLLTKEKFKLLFAK